MKKKSETKEAAGEQLLIIKLDAIQKMIIILSVPIIFSMIILTFTWAHVIAHGPDIIVEKEHYVSDCRPANITDYVAATGHTTCYINNGGWVWDCGSNRPYLVCDGKIV